MKAAKKLQSVRGMNDLLPAQSGLWQRVEAVLREVAGVYGYEEIRTPIVEKAELFTQSIGAVTDIVEKEMYAFADAGGDTLALRPEATASTVRACIQHGLLHNQQRRLWYLGPMFRRERPQKGRYRQFHQFGVEAFGWDGPDIDAEVIRLGTRIWRRLGLRDVRLQINTLGSPAVAANYRAALQNYLRDNRAKLDADSLRRLEANPLRVLDSKAAAMQEVIAGAPSILDFLDATAAEYFAKLRELLDAAAVEYTVNPRLVRGLDYYTGGVFEWVGGGLGDGAQNAVCAGGRYDNLVAMRGGKACAGVGFALGLERLVELVAAAGWQAEAATDVYVAAATAAAEAQAAGLSEALRDRGWKVILHCGGGALKRRLKRADASGARLAVLCGLGEKVQVKKLREGGQEEVEVDDLVRWCEGFLERGN